MRDLLITKKQRLLRSLKEGLSHVPRRIVASVAAKFSEVEKRLRLKLNNIEEVADQRQFIESLPRKVAELVAETDAAQVPPQLNLCLCYTQATLDCIEYGAVVGKLVHFSMCRALVCRIMQS